MQRFGQSRSWLSMFALASILSAGCTAPVKPPPLPPSASGSSSAPASYTLPDGTKVHDVKCSCCQH